MSETFHARPIPKRPANGLLAWQATMGYISTEYSPDALLTIQVYPVAEDQVAWAAAATWGQNGEALRDQPSLPVVLRDLWREIDRSYVIFNQKEAVLKRPANYADHEWLDADTEAILWRVVQVTHTVYGLDWQLVFVYQPIEKPEIRFQGRLLAQENSVQAGGTGPSLRDACRDLYRNAAPHYVASSGKALEDI